MSMSGLDANAAAAAEPVLGQFIDAAGEQVRDMPPFARDASALVPLYRSMVFVRTFDEKAVALQRTGRLGTYASSLGQEAVGIGLASAMQSDDVLLPSFREQGAMLWRGVSPVELLLYWGGDERGSDFQGPRRDFPISIPVASHLPHAVGVALAMKMRGEKRAAVAVTGDGGTSKGDFYEAINIAGVWRVPAVFVVNNNQWAISVPRSRQTAAADARAEGCGRRHSRRAGRRQRRRCHARRDRAGTRTGTRRRGAIAHRGRDLPIVRPHDRRRRSPLQERRRGLSPLEGGADRAPAQLSREQQKLVESGRGGASRGQREAHQ